MSNNLVFRGCRIRYIDLRRKDEGAPFTRLHLSADYTAPIQEAMDWNIGDGLSSAKLKGQLVAHNAVLTPNDKRLKEFETQIAIDEISDFQVVELKDDEGEASGRELRFIARSSLAGCCGIVENYWAQIAATDFVLKVSYSKQAVQQKLDVATDPGEDDEDSDEEDQGEAAETLIADAPIVLVKDKVCEANITLVEVDGGFAADSYASVKLRHPRALPPARTLPCLSEREALQASAQRVREFGLQLLNEEVTPAQRKSIQALLAGCDKHIFSEASVQ